MATKLYATRDFNDAGTGAAFKTGDDLTDAPGVENYAAAGLASKDAPEPAATPAPAAG